MLGRDIVCRPDARPLQTTRSGMFVDASIEAVESVPHCGLSVYCVTCPLLARPAAIEFVLSKLSTAVSKKAAASRKTAYIAVATLTPRPSES